MKKFAVLALALSAMFTLTACGSKEAAPQTEAAVEATTEATTETAEETTEAEQEAVVEEISETEKVGKVSDGEGNTTTATVTYENGAPVSIKFDCIQADGSSKYEAAEKGEYVMTEGGKTWSEQADALAAFLAENNFDVTKVTLTDEEGHTDAVSGVSIKVPTMLKAAEAVLAQ